MLLLAFSGMVWGQAQPEYEVQPIENYLYDYKINYRIIEKHIDVHPEWTIDQKLEFLKTEVNKLETDFISKRKTEYKSKSVERSVYHSCTSKESGVKRKCGWQYVYSPKEGMVTTKNDCRVIVEQGENKGLNVTDDGKAAGIKMSKAGKGKNAATLYATFRYSDKFIEQQVIKEKNKLFNMVIEK